MRTTRPVRNGSMWMSVARSSMARSSRSLTARTTGAPLARSRRLSTSSSARAIDVASASGDASSSSPSRRAMHGRDVLEGGDLDPDRTAEHDLGRAHRRDVVRIGEREPRAPVRARIGEHQRLAQEAAGELLRQRAARRSIAAGRCAAADRSPRPRRRSHWPKDRSPPKGLAASFRRFAVGWN